MTEIASYKELRRSRSDRMLAGVCGGLGRYFDVNPLFYRVGFVVLTLLGGAGALIYGASFLVIPVEGEQDSIAADVLRNHRQRPVALVGLALVGAAGIALLSHLTVRLHGTAIWAVVLIGGGLLLWSQRRRRPQLAPSGEPTSVTAVEPRPRQGVRRALIGTAVLIVAAFAAALAFIGFSAHLGDGVGDRQYHPLSAGARRDYRVGVGSLRLDLSRLPLSARPITIHAQVGVGYLRLIVPQGLAVRVNSHVGWGQADVLGHQEAGRNVRDNVGAAHARLVLDATVGVGKIDVERLAG
jgi:phage shock protein PspC (stress-responsive transcriptional regulator)